MNSMRLLLWASFATGAVLSSVIAQVQSEDESSAIPVAINRRQSVDLYTTLQENKTDVSKKRCLANNATYLVKERQCINNHYLFNECLFVVTPVGEFSTHRLVLNIKMAGNSTIAQTINMNNQTLADAIVIFRSREEQVNGSICNISSLEVYRGREQTTNISHQGFSLNENGTIEIYIDQLVHNPGDYVGELYRMNLSCSDRGLPEGGCLFFKVAGSTNVSEAKFNCSVPGTLPTGTPECTLTTTTPINDTEEELTTLPLTSDITETMTGPMTRTPTVTLPKLFAIGSPLFYGIVGLGAAIILVTLCIICMICVCIVLQCRRKYKRRPKIGATNYGQPAPYEEIQIRSMKTQGYFNNPSFKTADTIGPDNTTEHDSMENKYAEIGATYQEIAPRTRDPRQPAWARTSSAVTNAGSEQAPQEYSTLVQVGGHALRNSLVNSASDINSEQYAQLKISK